MDCRYLGSRHSGCYACCASCADQGDLTADELGLREKRSKGEDPFNSGMFLLNSQRS